MSRKVKNDGTPTVYGLRVAAGQCVDCGVPAERGRTRCDACNKKQNERARRLAAKYRAMPEEERERIRAEKAEKRRGKLLESMPKWDDKRERDHATNDKWSRGLPPLDLEDRLEFEARRYHDSVARDSSAGYAVHYGR